MKEKSLAERGVNLATSTAKPVIPPNVKLLANLKKVDTHCHDQCTASE